MESEGMSITGGKEKIFVSVRLNCEENLNNDVSDWECISSSTIVCKNVTEGSMYASSYKFDRVFGLDCSTKEVFEQGAKEVALSVLDGVNATVFVYGQNHSRKTWTVNGITEYALADIYDYVQTHPERHFVLKLSALKASCDSAKLLENPTEEILRDRHHASQLLLSRLDQKRSKETLGHARSPPSHHIIILTVESSVSKGSTCTLAATLSFVDLDGSDEVSEFATRRILEKFSGGNARTAIICTISTSRNHFQESQKTLHFASSLQQLANPEVNFIVSDKALVRNLQEEVARLDSELRNSQSSIATIIKMKDNQIEQLEKEIKALILQRDISQSQVKEFLNMLDGDASSLIQVENGHYPQFRVHESPDSEIQELEASGCSSRDHFARVPFSDELLNSNAFPRALVSSPHSSDIDYSYYSGEEIETRSNGAFEDPSPVAHVVAPEELSYQRPSESSFSYPEEAIRLHADDNITDMVSNSSPTTKDPGATKSGESVVKESELNGRGSSSPVFREKDYISIEYLDIASLADQSSLHRTNIENRDESSLKMTENARYQQETESSLRRSKKESQSLPEITLDTLNVSTAAAQDCGNAEKSELFMDKKFHKGTSEEASPKGTELTSRNVKDVQFDPLTSWPVEFKGLQREIVQLWHACNISLAHRTYFFLLFQGDPSDAMYMKMELKRLKALKDKFSHGEKATVNLRRLIYSSSANALRQERRMLCDQMSKKFSEKERESLFVEWSIDINAKLRRLKLARRVWTKTDDMEHVTSSAYLVAKLLGFIEPGHVPCKDMSKLNFFRRSPMGICSFKSSLKSIL